MNGESTRWLALAALLLLALPPVAAHQAVPDKTFVGPDVRSEALAIDDVLSAGRASFEKYTPVRLDSSEPADLRARWRDRAAVPYSLTFTSQGHITGAFGGVPIAGIFYGLKGEGVFILTVDGQAFVMGTYECTRGECSIVGEEVLGRPKSFLIFTNGLTGTFRGTLQGFYASRPAWLSAVEAWARENLDPSRVQSVVSAAARVGGK